MQKDTRFVTGLRWAGVIGVICARHEIFLGMGDLERGERCVILTTALNDHRVKRVQVSKHGLRP